MGIQRFVVALVDDDQSILRSVEYLESANCAVRLFTSAAMLLESGCLAHTDCLILHIDMPGTDGVELLGRIHATHAGLPTILITDDPDRLKRLPRLAGIYPGLFTKPLQPEELFAAVSDVLKKSAG
jgi:FixJ family two-component response regulator